MSTEHDDSSQNPQVTIHHVAACAGLSIASVSRALNDEKYVSEKTRQKVMDAVRELNYQPNYVARQMHRQKQFSIGVVLGKDAGTYTPFAMKVYESLQASFQQRGYRARQAQFLKSGKLKDTSAGYITIGLHESDPRYDVMHSSSSIVLDIGEARKSGLWVSSNDQQGGYLATQHLINSGCKAIHFICLHENHRVSRFRYQGYLDALRQNGLSIYAPIAVGDDAGTPALDTYRAITRLLHSGLKADGFVCFADTLATGACSAASDFGLKIPDDISVIGYDGIVGYGNIDLSSIRQDIDGLADSAAELLIDAMKSGEIKGRSLDVSLASGRTTRLS